MAFQLGPHLNRFDEVMRQKFGRTYDLRSLEAHFREHASGKRHLTAKDVAKLFGLENTPFARYWPRPQTKALEEKLSRQRVYVGPLKDDGKELMRKLLPVFHEIGTVPLLLRFAHPQRKRMRLLCWLMLLVTTSAIAWAQNEPCLAGTDSPDCGIKITLNPPMNTPDENIIWVPNEITIDAPLRLHATKVQLDIAPVGAQSTEQFKLLSETKHFKKVEGSERFHLELKSCPELNAGLVFYVASPRLPYAIVVNSKPFECKQRVSP